MRAAVLVILFVVLSWNAQLASAEDDITARLQTMQDQMKAMAEHMETQQKKMEQQDIKIEQQDRVISQLKTSKGEIGSSRGAEIFNASATDLTGSRKSDGNGNTNGDEKPQTPRRSWELPPVTVTGEREGATPDPDSLREEDPVGEYGQPRWTARRRFTETRAYVMPQGDIDFEYWSIVELSRKNAKDPPPPVETQYEVEMGLPDRFQIDLYTVSHSQGNSKGFLFDQQKAEVRWALADWDKIFGNPTLYAEYIWNNAPEADHTEYKLLFCGDAAKGWHWAYNQVYEHEMGGKQTNSYESTGGMSYTVKDEKFSVGAEVKLAYEDENRNRGLHQPDLLAGPSFQLSPLKQMHIDFTPEVGLTRKADKFKSLLIIGWEF